MADLRKAFDETAEANSELNPSLDAALIAAGRALADQVDAGVAEGEGHAALYLIPHIMNVLREMYATPKSRREADLGKEGAGGKLAEVRQLRNRPAPSKKRAAS